MARWIKCNTTDRTEIRLNLDPVVMIRPYPDDRGFTGSEIISATGSPALITVMENPDDLAGRPDIQQVRHV